MSWLKRGNQGIGDTIARKLYVYFCGDCELNVLVLRSVKTWMRDTYDNKMRGVNLERSKKGTSRTYWSKSYTLAGLSEADVYKRGRKAAEA
jgi:hypothetical protein